MSKYGGLQKHTDTVCIQCDQILYFYLKKLVALRVRLLANLHGQPWSLEVFQTGRTDTVAPQKTPSPSWASFSTDTTSFSFSYSSAAAVFCFFDKLKLKSCKAHFVLFTLCHCKPTMKDGGFSSDTCNDWWAISNRPIIQSHTDNAWLQCRQKTISGYTSCLKMQPILTFCGQTGMLAFHLFGP